MYRCYSGLMYSTRFVVLPSFAGINNVLTGETGNGSYGCAYMCAAKEKKVSSLFFYR